MEMKKGTVIASVIFGVLAAGLPHAKAAGDDATHASCETAVHLTAEAEKRMGGALYEGPMEGGEAMPAREGGEAMAGMTGAHELHIGQQGGAFFMAPNKIHHVEAKYSKECGVRLFIYNAFTEPISVGRFQAFFKIIPQDENEWDKEVIRFLTPSPDAAVLHARGDHDIVGLFKIELYVKFPESDDAELFNIPTMTQAH